MVRTHPSTDTPLQTPPRHDPSIGGALVRRTKPPTWHNASAAQPPATISSALPRSNGRGCSVAPWAPGTALGWAAPATVERRAVAAARASTVACCLLLGGIPLAR